MFDVRFFLSNIYYSEIILRLYNERNIQKNPKKKKLKEYIVYSSQLIIAILPKYEQLSLELLYITNTRILSKIRFSFSIDVTG